MLYCCADYKTVTRDKKFLQKKFFVCFSGIASFILKYKKLLKLKARKFHLSKLKTFFSEWVLFVLRACKATS